VAEGLEHEDYSDLAVFDADAPERPVEVLSLHGHWEPDQFAALIAQVARLYPGLYGIERNNHGLATLLACRRLGVREVHAVAGEEPFPAHEDAHAVPLRLVGVSRRRERHLAG
jgi:hypothetical protein